MAKANIPYLFAPGQRLPAQRLNANFNALKLASDSILDEQISPTASIKGTKLAETSVPGSKLLDETVSATQLAPGATFRSAVSVVGTTVGVGTAGIAEVVACTTPTLSTQGGPVLLRGNLSMTIHATDTIGTLTVRLYRVTGAVDTLLDEWAYRFGSGAGGEVRAPLPTPTVLDDTCPAGTHAWEIRVQSTSTGLNVEYDTATRGRFLAREMS